MTPASPGDASADEDRRAGVTDLMFVVAYGPIVGATLLTALVLAFDPRLLARFVQRSMPLAPDVDELAFGMAAGTALLAGLFVAAVWRARRGPLRYVGPLHTVGLPGAALFSAWFWLLVLAGVVSG